MENNKYYRVNKRSQAEALNFMGFNYYKFNDENGTVFYSFLKTEKFDKALEKLFKLRKEIGIIK